MDNLTLIGTIFGIIGLPLSILLWVVGPKDIINFLKKSFRRNEVNKKALLKLEDYGLCIHDREILQSPFLTSKYRDLFWPVVPSSSPNLIHATFIRYLIPLSEAGIKIHLFVFDEYASLVQDRPPDASKQWVEGFVGALEKMGLEKCDHKIVIQSKVMKTSRKASKLLPTMLKYLSTIRYKDLEAMAHQKKHILPETKAIRYIKPMLNMMYLLSLKGKFGYILSGIDEKPLWDAYKSVVNKQGLEVNPVKLYIPTTTSISGSNTNATDRDENIIFSDNVDVIVDKVKRGLVTLSTGNLIGYFLEYVIFSLGYSLDIAINSGTILVAKSLDEIIDIVTKNSGYHDEIANSIAMTIREALDGSLCG